MAKALLIKSSTGQKESIQGVWHPFEQATPYIQGIETGDLVVNIDAAVLNSMISGLPNVWSRARVFGYAFKYTHRDANIQTSGLIKFYDILIREWKGLIALMALLPDRIRISAPTELQPENLDELYDIPNAFGRMLFEDVDLWCDPTFLKEKKKQSPFIQLIYFNNVLIGATSPYTLVFTAINYESLPQAAAVPWYRNGRFDDPLEFGNLNNDQLQKLYLLVSNMVKKLPEFEKGLKQNRDGKESLDLSAILVFLQNWRNEIKAKGIQLVEEGALDAEITFAQPYMPIFRIKQEVFLNNGIFSYTAPGDSIDIQKILLQDEFIYSFAEIDDRQPMETSAIHFLTALDPEHAGKKWYFPIPVSEYGLKVFKNRIGDLISPPTDDKHELRASFKPNEFKIMVELLLRIDGKKQTPIVKEYEIKLLTGAQRNIILWPNFVSKDWTSYYLYSEYPSNGRDIKLVPFFKEYSQAGGYDGGEYSVDRHKNLVYIDSDKVDTDLDAVRIVKYPVEIATSDDHPYEIIRSNKPFAGLEIRSLIGGKDHVCGYLMLKKANDDSMGDRKMSDLSYETNFDEVVVGVDFGSNNSCLSYSKFNDSQVKPIPFTNRRVFILGAEVIDPNYEQTAVRHELLFFQNETPPNGQIKSWVHDHNHKYIPEGFTQEEIAGGIPVFEANLIIHDMDERTITTNAGVLHHSMKWLTDIKGKEKKKAYLKTVWIKAVADLYANRMLPKELRWSYPGSFSQFDVLQYEQMYNELAKVPIRNFQTAVSYEPKTESEAVCNYALTNIGLSSRNILLGIDVGGSTSDVLIVAMDRAARAFRLVKQSSLRMAASLLSEVISMPSSDAIRRAILKYHESPKCKIKIANMRNIVDKPKTSPFYFNAILDRLKEEDFNEFYSSLSQTVPQLFAIPAYITGLLLYYSGQLVSLAIKENNFEAITIVDFLPFGKGGRIFDWLDTFPGKRLSTQYYNDCFKAGFGEGAQNIRLEKKDTIRKDNKSEVSKGLSAPQKVTVDPQVRENSDIFGEDGYMYFANGSNQGVEMKATDTIRTEHLAEMDFGIETPSEFVRFNQFLSIFIDFTGPRKTGIIKNIAAIENKRADLERELKGYIVNDAEWQKADEQRRMGQSFEYKHSMLLLEGLCFLEKSVIPEVFKN